MVVPRFGESGPGAEHMGPIAKLASELDVPVHTVKEIYCGQLERLSAEARIPSFLSVLATRHTRHILRAAAKDSVRGRA